MAMTIVMGLPGAGKSTVLAAASRKKDYKVLNWGDLMFEIAAKKHSSKIKVRDDIRSKLTPSEQKALQAEVGDALAKMEGKVVLDTHCSIETPRGYLPGLPLAILSKFKVSQLVYITGSPQEIFTRRNADASRARPGSVESIRAHDEYNKMLLASYSVITGAPAKVIMNAQGKVEEAQKEFVALLE